MAVFDQGVGKAASRCFVGFSMHGGHIHGRLNHCDVYLYRGFLFIER